MSQLRRTFGRLFSQLIDDEREGDLDDGDYRASARLLSNALLNFASVAGPGGMARLEGALPWLGALAAWYQAEYEQGEAEQSTRELAQIVRRAGGGLALGAPAIERRLSLALARGDDERNALVAGLARAARDDRRLRSCGERSDATLADAVLEQTELLRLVVDVVAHGSPAGFANRFEAVFPVGAEPEGNSARGLRGRRRALEMLAALESGAIERLAKPGALDSSSRNFEIGLARHMSRAGVARTVRAALAFGPGTMDGASSNASPASIGSWLRSTPGGRARRGWPELGEALAENRWRFVRYLAVEVPKAHLQSWSGFLTEGCREFADREGLSVREAVHFAHYCMHLMNVCDLATLTDGGLTDGIRQSLLEIENELKEGAISRQGKEASGGWEQEVGRPESNASGSPDESSVA